MTAEQHSQNPYPGPRPFERDEEKIFFGRDSEVENLLSLITAHPVVLLYAQSGAGKTSLLSAGLIPLMKEEDEEFEVLPVARVRGFDPKGMALEKIDNIYVFNALMSWAGNEVDPGSCASMSVANFLKEKEHPTDERGIPLPRLIVFDQFEELFTFYPECWTERDNFFIQIAEALRSDPTLRVLFVLREDYLANLTPYAKHLPERLGTRYRLERLRRAAACSAVEGPLHNTDRSFAEGVAVSLVQELLKVRIKGDDNEMVEVPGEYVEPVQLQVVCQNLWLNLPSDVEVITSDHLQAFGDVEEALRGFYERAIGVAKVETGVREDDLRRWFSTELITPAKTRGTVFRGEEQTGSILNSVVDVLEHLHIVRAEMRAGSRWYELTHDRLVEPILKANEASIQLLLAEEQKRQIEAERERAKAKEQARTIKRFRKLTAGLVVLILAAIVTATFAFYQRTIAESQKARANAAEKEAVVQRKRAEEQAKIAEEEREKVVAQYRQMETQYRYLDAQHQKLEMQSQQLELADETLKSLELKAEFVLAEISRASEPSIIEIDNLVQEIRTSAEKVYPCSIIAEPSHTALDKAVTFRGSIKPDVFTKSELEEVEYKFSFGDGEVTSWSDRDWTEHIYSTPGVYEATLEVMSGSKRYTSRRVSIIAYGRYTGIVFNAHNKGMKRKLFPKVYYETEDGGLALVYGDHAADRPASDVMLWSGWAQTLDDAKSNPKVRDNPLVIEIFSVSEDGESIIRKEDAEMIDVLEEDYGFLRNGKIVFVY